MPIYLALTPTLALSLALIKAYQLLSEREQDTESSEEGPGPGWRDAVGVGDEEGRHHAVNFSEMVRLTHAGEARSLVLNLRLSLQPTPKLVTPKPNS